MADPFVEVELGAFYVDGVAMDPSTSTPQLINRDPEPSETQAPDDGLISLEIVDVGPDGIDEAATRVYVQGALAFNGSGFVAPYNGAGAAVSSPFFGVLRIVVDPMAVWPSLTVVTVRVVSQTMGGIHLLDQTYTFRVEDLTAPRVTAAQGRELKRVRVVFDEAVLQVDGGASNDALNPANYSFQRHTIPSVAINATSVEPVSDSSVDVLLDIPASPDGNYTVVVANVEDLFGNAVASPYDRASWTGFRPPRPRRRRWDLWAMLPERWREDDAKAGGDLRIFIACLQDITDVAMWEYFDSYVARVLDPDTAEERYVDLMLGEIGNPFTYFELDLANKRRLISILVQAYKQKGTAKGIKNVIRFFLGLEVTIQTFNNDRAMRLGRSRLGTTGSTAWRLGIGTSRGRFSFQITADQVLTDEQRLRIRQIARYMKPAHTHFVRLIEPTPPVTIHHLALGRSRLGVNWILHP